MSESPMHRDRRRDFLVRAGGVGLLIAATAPAAAAAAKAGAGTEKKKGKGEGEPEVAPPEDLMREHGVLNRILLMYEEGIRRVDAKQPFPAEAVASAADI